MEKEMSLLEEWEERVSIRLPIYDLINKFLDNLYDDFVYDDSFIRG